MKTIAGLLILMVCLPSTALSQLNATRESASPTKTATAVRIHGAIKIDGKLDEALWDTAAPITDFVQKDPVEGAVPSDKLEVRFLYDDDALYVGTR